MSLIKSQKRVADHGEVFTSPWMVEAMLDLVKDETDRLDSRFLEQACGSGNFLVRILQRKLAAVEVKFGKADFEKRQYALLALMCTYGIELLADNIAECRANMLEILADHLNLDESEDLYRAATYVLSQNLVHGDALTMRTSDGQPIAFLPSGATWARASSSGATSVSTSSPIRPPSVRRIRSSHNSASTRSSCPSPLPRCERMFWRHRDASARPFALGNSGLRGGKTRAEIEMPGRSRSFRPT